LEELKVKKDLLDIKNSFMVNFKIGQSIYIFINWDWFKNLDKTWNYESFAIKNNLKTYFWLLKNYEYFG
jgi:hypothetical protein